MFDEMKISDVLSLDLPEVKREAVQAALRDVLASRRRVDPKVRRQMRKLRQRAKSKRKQKSRKRKPIRKEKGKLILDVSPFTFNKAPEAKRSVMNPVTRNKVKIKSLSGHMDMRAYKVYQKHYRKWKNKWKAKYEKIKERQQKKEQQQKGKKASEELSLCQGLVHLAYQQPGARKDILHLLMEG